MKPAYYNEIDPYAAAWLRNLIAAGLIPTGDVDTRSIADVQPGDLDGYAQCHFFAGLGGWAYAARLAGWPDDRALWTGSCPCQPFSVAGQGKGAEDERHLWPEFARLIRACRPAVVMGEQVAAAVGKSWLDGVCADLEGVGYACRAVVVPACSVDAPHRRDRLWFVADARGERWDGRQGCGGVGWATPERREACFDAGNRSGAFALADTNQPSAGSQRAERGGEQRGVGDNSRHRPWADADWITGADGKARRVEPSIRLLAHGLSARVGRLRAYGNAIVPQVAAEVIAAYLDAHPTSAAGETERGA